MTIDDFYNEIIEVIPDIKNGIKESLNEYGERLDTIIIEDVIMPIVIQMMDEDVNTQKIREIFNIIEECITNGDKYLVNVVNITILEMLGNEKSTLDKALIFMGKQTKKCQREADRKLGRI